jgi:hypothetical protein
LGALAGALFSSDAMRFDVVLEIGWDEPHLPPDSDIRHLAPVNLVMEFPRGNIYPLAGFFSGQ